VNPDLVAGAQALQRGRFEEGIARTQSGLDTFVTREQRAAALSNLCAGYTALGKYDIAVIHCSASLELEPGWQAYNNRALAYLGKGLLRLAGRDCTQGLILNPDSEQLLQVRVLVEEAGRRRSGRTLPDPTA
jgi:tetratricopeptide (TPR) repeat protein